MSALQQAAKAAAGQFAFHRDQHHGWRRAAAFLLVISAGQAVVFVCWIAWHSTVYITVAATPDGRIIPATPLDEPIMSDAALRNWAVTAVTEAFTLGHHDWRMRLGSVREYFTDEGYEGFIAGLEESLFLDRLVDNLQVAAAVAQGAPVITSVSIVDGQAAWAVEFPMLVTFHAGERRLHQDLLAKVLVVRVPISERVAGIGIRQLIATRASG